MSCYYNLNSILLMEQKLKKNISEIYNDTIKLMLKK